MRPANKLNSRSPPEQQPAKIISILEAQQATPLTGVRRTTRVTVRAYRSHSTGHLSRPRRNRLSAV